MILRAINSSQFHFLLSHQIRSQSQSVKGRLFPHEDEPLLSLCILIFSLMLGTSCSVFQRQQLGDEAFSSSSRGLDH